MTTLMSNISASLNQQDEMDLTSDAMIKDVDLDLNFDDDLTFEHQVDENIDMDEMKDDPVAQAEQVPEVDAITEETQDDYMPDELLDDDDGDMIDDDPDEDLLDFSEDEVAEPILPEVPQSEDHTNFLQPVESGPVTHNNKLENTADLVVSPPDKNVPIVDTIDASLQDKINGHTDGEDHVEKHSIAAPEIITTADQHGEHQATPKRMDENDGSASHGADVGDQLPSNDHLNFSKHTANILEEKVNPTMHSNVESTHQDVGESSLILEHISTSDGVEGEPQTTHEHTTNESQDLPEPEASLEHRIDDQHFDGYEYHTTTGLHPTIVKWNGHEYSLFPSDEPLEGEEYFIEDENLVHNSIGDLLQACRFALGSDISTDEELEISFDDLNLSLTEISTPAFSTSFYDVLNLYIRLCHNGSFENIPPMTVTLTSRPRFTTRYAMLLNAAIQGKTLSHIANPEIAEHHFGHAELDQDVEEGDDDETPANDHINWDENQSAKAVQESSTNITETNLTTSSNTPPIINGTDVGATPPIHTLDSALPDSKSNMSVQEQSAARLHPEERDHDTVGSIGDFLEDEDRELDDLENHVTTEPHVDANNATKIESPTYNRAAALLAGGVREVRSQLHINDTTKDESNDSAVSVSHVKHDEADEIDFDDDFDDQIVPVKHDTAIPTSARSDRSIPDPQAISGKRALEEDVDDAAKSKRPRAD